MATAPVFESKARNAERVRRVVYPAAAGEPAQPVGIAPHLRDFGITEAALPSLADKAFQDGCHQLNPRPCTREDLLELYRRAL